MPKINPDDHKPHTGTGYPSPFDAPVTERIKENLSDAGGLSQFGVKRITLPPGVWASQRHAHSGEDEFVYILSGNPTLIDNNGETELHPGASCTHPAGDGNAHHLVNRSDTDAVFLVVGTRAPETDSVVYPDIDMDLPANGTDSRVFTRKSGKPY